MNVISAEVVKNEEIAPDTFRLILRCHLRGFIPGQFISICCPNTIFPRPFSIAGSFFAKSLGRSDLSETTIMFKRIGAGTTWLSQVKPREKIEFFGPLGNGFDISSSWEKIIFVAGGIGIASIIPVIDHYQLKPSVQGFLYRGTKTRAELLLYHYFCSDYDAVDSTDDGSFGQKGQITEYLSEGINRIKPNMIFACGPRPMLAEVKRITIEHDIPCQICVEEIMACGGQGHCCGCAIKRADGNGYLSVCQAGPVFDAKEVALE